MINKYFFIFISVGLLIAANPYLAIKVYPENQNIWQDCYATPMASLRHFSVLTKNSLRSNSFASTEKCSDGLFILDFIQKKKKHNNMKKYLLSRYLKNNKNALIE